MNVDHETVVLEHRGDLLYEVSTYIQTFIGRVARSPRTGASGSHGQETAGRRLLEDARRSLEQRPLPGRDRQSISLTALNLASAQSKGALRPRRAGGQLLSAMARLDTLRMLPLQIDSRELRKGLTNTIFLRRVLRNGGGAKSRFGPRPDCDAFALIE